MKYFQLIFLLSVLLFLSCDMVKADETIYLDSGLPKIYAKKGGVLKGGVVISKELPKDLYGTWSVFSTVIDSSMPDIIKRKGNDIWTLAKNNGIVTLSNPVTGATASINVNEVKGNKATFTREEISKKYKRTETVTLTVDGTNFFGENYLKTDYYSKNKYLYSDFIEYEVKAVKLSGPPIKELLE